MPMVMGKYRAVIAFRYWLKERDECGTALPLCGGFIPMIDGPLSASLVEQLGWRGACLTYAAFISASACRFCLQAFQKQTATVVTPQATWSVALGIEVRTLKSESK